MAACRAQGFYRHFEARAPARADTDLRGQIQLLSLKHRHYGYRRIAAQLKRNGLIVNAKRVLRLMRGDNLLCQRQSPFVPRTTDSRHSFAIVPNLLWGLVPSGINQIWVADITYVRLSEAFIYLAVVLDAFSEKSLAGRSTATSRQGWRWPRSTWRWRRAGRAQTP